MIRRFTAMQFFCGSGLLLAAVNFRHFQDPPYWDALLGVYRQGLWMLGHGINYRALFQERSYAEGGPRVHTLCVWSPLFALLARRLSTTTVWYVLHGLNFLAASAALSFFFSILRRLSTGTQAMLWVAVAASNPIWSAQTASIYLEIPLAAVLGLSFWAMDQKRDRLAAIACLAAYFVKNAAFLAAVALALSGITYSLVNRLAPSPETKDRSLLWLVIPAPVMFCLDHWGGDTVVVGRFSIGAMAHNVALSLKLSPALYPTLILQGILLFGLGIQAWRERRHSAALRHCYLVLFVAGFWCSFMISQHALLRYTVMAQLPTAALLCLLLRRHPNWSTGIAGALIVFHLLNQQGRLLRPLPTFIGRSGDRLERSRECLTDLQSNRTLCHWIESNAQDRTVFAKWPLSLMLAFPELGYVSHGLPGLVDVNATRCSDISQERARSLTERDRETWDVFQPSIFELGGGPPLAPRELDHVLWIDQRLPAPLMVLRREWTLGEWEQIRRAVK